MEIKDRSSMNISLSLIFAAVLVSCGGGSGDGDGDGDDKVGVGETKWGMINVDEAASGGSGPEVEFDALFVQVNASVPVNLIKDSFLPSLALDTCEVKTFEFGSESPSGEESDPQNIDGVTASSVTISAGETIIIMDPVAGSYGEMTKQTLLDNIFYSGDSVPGPIPTRLTVDIPGDVFPAFSNVPIPNAGGLVVTSPTGGAAITPDTTFTWNASSDPDTDTFIDISTSSTDAVILMSIEVNCVATDDGSFVFPATTKTAMGASFSGFATDITRTAIAVEEKNGAILIVVGSSSN